MTPSPVRPAFPRALVGLLAAAVLAVLAGLLPGVLPGSALSPAAHAAGPNDPVRLVLVTSGLSWEDVSPDGTPALAELTQNAGAGAMNTTSTTLRATQRQGTETLHTGYRGLAAEAPRTAGVPTPATDLLADIPGGVAEIDASTRVDPAALRRAVDASGLVIVDLGSADAAGGRPDTADHAAALRSLDARLTQVVEATGAGTASGPRTLLASVAPFDAPDAEAARRIERGGAPMPERTGLQLLLDTGYPGRSLTSGATHQSGLVVLTDLAPTILASHDLPVPAALPGQPITGEDTRIAPTRLALDRTQAADRVTGTEVIALAVWMVPTGLPALALLVPAVARRHRVAAVLRRLAVIAPLALPAGLCAGIVPWWRSAHPTGALIGTVVAGSALLAAVVLLGPWRRHRSDLVGAAAVLTAGGILAESATGSRLQVGSPLGAQPITGGRFYGLSNHLFGMVLAAALIALLCLVVQGASRRVRVLATLLTGAVVAGVAVAPSMGADFGSMLVTVPTFGLLALMLSGLRVRAWHVLGLGFGGAALVLAVSFLDWLRPPEARTHLGRFIDDLLGGRLLTVVVRKLAQNLGMTVGYPGLLVVLVLALVASVAILAPARFRLQRLAALDAAHPGAWAVRLCLVLGTWAGYLVNDTGPVLVAAVLGVALCLLPPLLPDPAADPTAGPGAPAVLGAKAGHA
ncbi:hypothetical protein JSY14_08420 [Brachybacterium sp. EF45031]|uniref:hypothetical protein n=1 Tax=Brachybacterium sillae TaxID=2810536 RepID=UPI00217EF3AA|nr:hypothetical protein [Brachybacterium sillae]MCS6712042.1 hypothetical protein [Brachybacterium sillae]